MKITILTALSLGYMLKIVSHFEGHEIHFADALASIPGAAYGMMLIYESIIQGNHPHSSTFLAPLFVGGGWGTKAVLAFSGVHEGMVYCIACVLLSIGYLLPIALHFFGKKPK